MGGISWLIVNAYPCAALVDRGVGTLGGGKIDVNVRREDVVWVCSLGKIISLHIYAKLAERISGEQLSSAFSYRLFPGEGLVSTCEYKQNRKHID